MIIMAIVAWLVAVVALAYSSRVIRKLKRYDYARDLFDLYWRVTTTERPREIPEEDRQILYGILTHAIKRAPHLSPDVLVNHIVRESDALRKLAVSPNAMTRQITGHYVDAMRAIGREMTPPVAGFLFYSLPKRWPSLKQFFVDVYANKRVRGLLYGVYFNPVFCRIYSPTLSPKRIYRLFSGCDEVHRLLATHAAAALNH